MSREVWGTFAVNDHLATYAFVADVMLYDRLVLPVPPNDKEWQRWQSNKWEPERLRKLLAILGKDRVREVPWDENRQAQWRKRFEAGKEVARDTQHWAFQASRTQLTMDLPAYVTGVEAVTRYASLNELESAVGLKSVELDALPTGAVTAILGREFLVPDDPKRSHEDLLRAAVDLSSDSEFRRKRANFWRWQREFLDEKTVITDRAAVQKAIEEMRDLLEEEAAIVRRAKMRTATRFAFLVGTVTMGVFTSSMAPVVLPPLAAVLGQAFLSVGQFSAEQLLEKKSSEDQGSATSLFADARRHFGWQ